MANTVEWERRSAQESQERKIDCQRSCCFLTYFSLLLQENNNILKKGDHEYTDMVIHRDTGGSECLVIDIDFQSHFEIARAVPLQQIYWGVMYIGQDCWLPLLDFDYHNQVHSIIKRQILMKVSHNYNLIHTTGLRFQIFSIWILHLVLECLTPITSDYKTGDRMIHTYFCSSGESYAGVYLPTLASEIVKGLDAGSMPVLNFKGFMVGNGVTDEVYDGNALVPFAHGMALISDNLFEDVTTACNGSFWNSTNNICSELLDKVYQDVADLNIYDFLEPCFHSTEARETDTSHPRLPSKITGTQPA